MASPDSSASSVASSASMLRWILFTVIVVAVTMFHLFVDFKGLSHAKGMDQAQIGREIARGNNMTTKVIRPVHVFQVNQRLQEKLDNDAPGQVSPGVSLEKLKDAYHSPLNPLLNSLLFMTMPAKHTFDAKSPVFFLDYVVAAAAMLLLLAAIWVSYLLIARIFDRTIAGITATMLLFCKLNWFFAGTGLPQMLMLFLFSFALYFLYKAVENVQTGQPAYLWAFLTGLFFALLALAHWLTVWMFFGVLLYAAFFLRPRGVLALIMFGIFALITVPWAWINYDSTGNVLGLGLYQFYSGLASGSESVIMRNFNPEADTIVIDGVMRKLVLTLSEQMANITLLQGSIIAAPIFFLSLLHPFRRPEIAQFRWAILIIWAFAALGMGLFGLPEQEKDPNQLHLLFVPIMAAYGLAMLAVWWSRLGLLSQNWLARYGHFAAAVIISAAPMAFSLPWDIARGLRAAEYKQHYPPYYPRIYPALAKQMNEKAILATDAPWATAWYGDRLSLWIPKGLLQFNKLAESTKAKGNPVGALFFTPLSTHQPYSSTLTNKAGEWYDWRHFILTTSAVRDFGVADPLSQLEGFAYRYPMPLGSDNADMIMFTDTPPQR
jgi:hypothetical protein